MGLRSEHRSIRTSLPRTRLSPGRTPRTALAVMAASTVLLAACSPSRDSTLENRLTVQQVAPPSTLGAPPTGLLEGLRAAVPGSPLPPEIADRLRDLDPGLTDLRGAGAAYDLATMAMLAAEQARSDAPGRIAEQVIAVSRTGNACNSYAVCLAMLDERLDIDYGGLSGAIDFRYDGRPSDIGLTEVTFDAADQLRETRTLNAQNPEPDVQPQGPDPRFGPMPDGHVRIATVLPVLGDNGIEARAALAGIKLAVADANAAGGALGDPVELIADESGDGSVAAAETAARKAVTEQHADVVIGGITGAMSQALIPIVTGSGSVLLSSTDGDPTPDGIDDRHLYYRLAPADSIRSVATADEVTIDGHTEAHIVAANGATNDRLVYQIGAELDKRGARLSKVSRYDPAAPDLGLVAIDVFQTGAQATIILGGIDDTARLIKALAGQTRGPKDTPTYGTDLNVRTELAIRMQTL